MSAANRPCRLRSTDERSGALMLSVGREINIKTKNLACRGCGWEGRGAELSSGLIRISRSAIYVYAYRCPRCGCFDIACKGKLLDFRPRVDASARDNARRSKDIDAAESQFTGEKAERAWT